jgi:hypothetical protein
MGGGRGSIRPPWRSTMVERCGPAGGGYSFCYNIFINSAGKFRQNIIAEICLRRFISRTSTITRSYINYHEGTFSLVYFSRN